MREKIFVWVWRALAGCERAGFPRLARWLFEAMGMHEMVIDGLGRGVRGRYEVRR